MSSPRRPARTLAHVLAVLSGILAGLVGTSGPAQAFRLVPIEMDFAPSGRDATKTFSISNDAADPVAVEVTIMSRTMAESGQDQLADASDTWVVFPEQIVLQPGETQTIRVQWIGNPAPTKEIPFRLIAEQLAIDIGKAPAQGGQVRLLVKYIASLYVVPPDARANVALVSAAPADNGAVLELVARNEGTKRQILKDASLKLSAGGQTLTLDATQLEGFAGENILGGTTRRFRLPWPKGLPVGPVTANLILPPS